MVGREKITICIVGCAAAWGAVERPASAAFDGGVLTYVERSNGLQSPGMEGGNTELEFGDVNGDGHVDLVSIGDHGSPFVNSQQHGVMVWFGDGAGNWSVFQNGNFGYGGVALGDVNNDGLMDVGYGMHHDYSSTDFGDQIQEVSLGDGTGTNWTPWDDGLATNGETWGMFGTDFADVDNDGDLDLGSISFGCCAGIHIYLNNGDGTWTQSWGFVGGNSAQYFYFADFNGDGNADFAAAHGNGTVWLGDGEGNFTPASGNLPAGPWRRGVAVGDVNGDGRDDIAYRTTTGVQVWTMPMDGMWSDLTGSLATAGAFDLTQIADMNLDGHGDIVAFTEDLVRIYAGDGAGGWSIAGEIILPDGCDYAAMRAGTDVDHNGFPDLAIVQEENCGPFTGGRNRLRAYVEDSTPVDAFIVPKYPRGGETWIAGSVRFIDWHAGVPDAHAGALMTIELSTTGPDGPWIEIAADQPDNGRFQWLLPSDLPSTDHAHLRFTLNTQPATIAVTPAPFSIIGAGTTLTDFHVDFGTLISGTLDDLRESDDSRVRVRSGVGFSAVDANLIDIHIGAVTDVDTPSTIDLTVEGRIDHPEGIVKLRLRNWSSGGGAFEQVHQYTIGMTETTETVFGIDAANRVRASDSRIELSLRQSVVASFSLAGFRSFTDWVEISVR